MDEFNTNQPQGTTRTVEMPAWITGFGTLNIAIGSLELLSTLMAIFDFAVAFKIIALSIGMILLLLFIDIASLGFSIWLLVLGAGLLTLKRWARRGTILYAKVMIMWVLIGAALNLLALSLGWMGTSKESIPFIVSMCGGLIVLVLYPILILIFMKETKVALGIKLCGWFILVISIIALPLMVFLISIHRMIPLLIILPLGMLGVGLDKIFDGRSWKHIIRWVTIILFAVGAVSAFVMWYTESYNGMGVQMGEKSAVPQNIIFFLFLFLLFLYSSPSEKIQKFCSPLVWFGFIITLMCMCVFIGSGFLKMLG